MSFDAAPRRRKKAEEKIPLPVIPDKLYSVKAAGMAVDTNRRFRRTMEDYHAFEDAFGGVESQGYFAVYDGHGGKQAAEYCASAVHSLVLKHLAKDSANGCEALRKAFIDTEEELNEKDIIYPGCTAVACLIQQKDNLRTLYTANAGDARAVLCRNGVAVRLTYDHKATDEAEIQRIKEAGGAVVNGRVNGFLAVTRALGDMYLKQFVVSDPHTVELPLSADDSILVLACDGVFDVMSDQEVVDFVCERRGLTHAPPPTDEPNTASGGQEEGGEKKANEDDGSAGEEKKEEEKEETASDNNEKKEETTSENNEKKEEEKEETASENNEKKEEEKEETASENCEKKEDNACAKETKEENCCCAVGVEETKLSKTCGKKPKDKKEKEKCGAGPESLGAIAKQLVQSALERGSTDNISVILIEL